MALPTLLKAKNILITSMSSTLSIPLIEVIMVFESCYNAFGVICMFVVG